MREGDKRALVRCVVVAGIQRKRCAGAAGAAIRRRVAHPTLQKSHRLAGIGVQVILWRPPDYRHHPVYGSITSVGVRASDSGLYQQQRFEEMQ